MEPWSFLFFAGYVTATQHVFRENRHYYTLTVPNKEILTLYKELTLETINQAFTSEKHKQLTLALITGNISSFDLLLREFIFQLCSFHDLPHNDLERSLHMFVLGLLASLSEKYVIKSNLESGEGRYDILMYPKRENVPAVVVEFKKGKNNKLHRLADQALDQIRTGKYASLLKDFGYKGQFFCYGIAGFKKHVVSKMETTCIS